MKVKEESENLGLMLNIQKMKIMASGPITTWEIDGETVSDFIFLGSKITADGNCSHEIKRHLILFPVFWEVDHGGSCCDLCRRVFCLFSARIFIVSGFTFRSLIHFEFIFVCGVRK